MQTHAQTHELTHAHTLTCTHSFACLCAQGAGASSTVFKGFQFRENRFVAVKKINVLDRETRQQMLNDVKVRGTLTLEV